MTRTPAINCRKSVEPKIINLSSRDLTRAEIKLLKRELKFTPTPQADKKGLEADMQEFQRKLRLLEYFQDYESTTKDSIVKNRSNFVPPKSNDEYLSIVLNTLTTIPDSAPTTKTRNNISRGEITALRDLKDDDKIIIKAADKGGATVIIDKTFYKDKIMELLTDHENYVELESNQDPTIMKNINCLIMKNINCLIKKYQNELTKKESDCIQNFTYKTSNFYGLPKIHKSTSITTAIKEQNADYIHKTTTTSRP